MRQLYQVLRVAPTAYYVLRHRQQQLVVEPVWQAAVRKAFMHHSRRYGTRRLRPKYLLTTFITEICPPTPELFALRTHVKTSAPIKTRQVQALFILFPRLAHSGNLAGGRGLVIPLQGLKIFVTSGLH